MGGVEQTGRLWDPDELLTAFSTPATNGKFGANDEASLPAELLKDIRDGGVGKGNEQVGLPFPAFPAISA